MTAPGPAPVRPADGEAITEEPHREVRLLVADAPALTVTWSRYGRGEGAAELHVHRRHTDAFYVVAGTLTFRLGDRREHHHRAPAGTVVVVPRDVPHELVNLDAPDAVFLNMHAPDEGFAAYMRALRDGRPASFDQDSLPVDGTAPAEAATFAPGRYADDDLVVRAGDGQVEIAVPGAAPVTVLLG
jgi:mannose-6-phosphate isomerase-like protein (cupin superfamily)